MLLKLKYERFLIKKRIKKILLSKHHNNKSANNFAHARSGSMQITDFRFQHEPSEINHNFLKIPNEHTHTHAYEIHESAKRHFSIIPNSANVFVRPVSNAITRNFQIWLFSKVPHCNVVPRKKLRDNFCGFFARTMQIRVVSADSAKRP